jgi:dihydroorotate dehydrogenase electron transfer subunit
MHPKAVVPGVDIPVLGARSKYYERIMSETIPATGRVLVRQDYPGGYTLLRIAAKLAIEPKPGQMLRIDGAPWTVLRPAPEQGWVDCLQRDATPPMIDTGISVRGPFGNPFDLDAATPRALLFADSHGIAQIVFLARGLRARRPRVKPFALFDLVPPLPFRPLPSRIMTPGLPAGVIAALPLLEDWGIPSRIACSADDQPGCFGGAVTELARDWLEISQGVADVTVFACGGSELLDAVRDLASGYQLVCQTRAAS